MAQRWKWFAFVFSGASGIASIASWVGIPVSALSASALGIWGWLASYGALSVVLIFLFSFASILWSIIGIVWLVQRTQGQARGRYALLDASWGVRVDGGMMIISDINPASECSVGIKLRNALDFPIMVEFIDEYIGINDLVPDMVSQEQSFPLVINSKDTLIKNFRAYRKGKLLAQFFEKPDELFRLEGIISFKAKYGHPDVGFSRVATRDYSFSVAIKVNNADGQATGPKYLNTPLPLSTTKQDRDAPYSEPASSYPAGPRSPPACGPGRLGRARFP